MDSNNMYNQTTNQEQGSYQQPQPYQNEPTYQPQGSYQPELEEPVKLGEWLIAMLVMCVPCVNIVMMFVWAFSKSEKKSKSNFFKAELIVMGIMFVLWIVLMVTIGISAASVIGGSF